MWPLVAPFASPLTVPLAPPLAAPLELPFIMPLDLPSESEISPVLVLVNTVPRPLGLVDRAMVKLKLGERSPPKASSSASLSASLTDTVPSAPPPVLLLLLWIPFVNATPIVEEAGGAVLEQRAEESPVQ